MAETSNILDSTIEDILGEVDEDIKYENIDADAILGEVDEFLAENAIKTENKSAVSAAGLEEEEEEFEDEEEEMGDEGEESEEKRTSRFNSDAENKRHFKQRGFRNFDDYGGLNFRGPFLPDMMGMPRGPPFMPFHHGPMHPRFYHGYRGPLPGRYPMMGPGGRPPFPPHPIYGPPMGPMRAGLRPPYGSPMMRGLPPHGRYLPPNAVEFRRHQQGNKSEGQKKEQDEKKSQNGNEANKQMNEDRKDGKQESMNSNAESNFQSKSQNNRFPRNTQQLQRPFQNQQFNNKRPITRAVSPVLKLPTVRIGGSGGTASTSSSHSSIVGSSSQTLIPPASNVNAVITASLRAPLTTSSSRHPPAVSISQQNWIQQPQQQQQLARTMPQVIVRPLAQPATIMMIPQQNVPYGQQFPIQQSQNMYVRTPQIISGPTQMQPGMVNSGISSDAVNWSLMVDAFVKKTSDFDKKPTGMPRRSFSRSPSRSFSRSPSGGRYSSRYGSQASGISSRSRSRSPMPARSPRSPLPSRNNRRSRRVRNYSGMRDRRVERPPLGNVNHRGSSIGTRRTRRMDGDLRNDKETKEEMKHTRECAEAIGLDEEYLRKVEEQKRLREEFARLRSQKRQQNFHENVDEALAANRRGSMRSPSHRSRDVSVNRGREELVNRGRDDILSRGRDEMAIRGRDEVANRGRDEMAIRGRDEVANRGRDEMAIRGRDEVANRGRDEVASRGRDEVASRGRDEVASRGRGEVASRGHDESRGVCVRGGNSLPRKRGDGRRSRTPEERDRHTADRRRSSPSAKVARRKSMTPPPSTFTAMPNTTKIDDRHHRHRHGDARILSSSLQQQLSKSKARESTARTAAVVEPENAAAAAASGGKLKAYLAVVVSNVKALENSYKRISALTNAIGSTKKVWQTSENTISIIFTKHEHAKQFMLEYHGKNLSGNRLDVSLEKVFLNLATMP